MRITLFPPKDMFEIGARTNQEDSIFPATGQAKDSDRLFVLCDGMGGHEHGEMASAAICQGVSEYFQEHIKSDDVLVDEQLRNALDHAYLKLDAIDDGAFRKAGTTMTMLFFHRGGCTAAHIGDSRIYHVRPSSRTILYKSKDHSLVYELYQMGEISYEEMKTHRRKNQITRAMLPGADNREVADIVHITDIQPGDYFFLCSDGVLENLDDPDILEWMASDTDDDQKRKWLIKNTTKSKDNHSAFLIRIKGVESEEGDESLLNDEQTVRFNAINIHPDPKKQPEPAVETPPVSERQGGTGKQNVSKTERKPKRLSLATITCLLAGFIVLATLLWWFFNKSSSEKSETTESTKTVSANPKTPDGGGMASENAPDIRPDEDGLDNNKFKEFEEKYRNESEQIDPDDSQGMNDLTAIWGEYNYRGSKDDKGQPHGEGQAFFRSGTYTGPFAHGVMEGDDVVFEFKNGNVFIGSFKGNYFSQGVLSLDSEHRYFKGRFKGKRPWDGAWYFKYGNKIYDVVDGKKINPRGHDRQDVQGGWPNGSDRSSIDDDTPFNNYEE